MKTMDRFASRFLAALSPAYLLAAVLAIGCGSSEAQNDKTPDAMSMFAASAPEEPAPTASNQASEPVQEVNLQELNTLVREYVRATKKIPKDLREIAESGFARNLPSPPPGKDFAIMLQPLGYEVVLVNR